MSDLYPILRELDISLESLDSGEIAVFSGPSEISAKTISALRAGDHDAYNKIFNAYHASVKRFLYVMVRCEDTAQELAQEVFINLWVKRQTLNPSFNIKGFLYTTSKFYMLRHFKHNKVVQKYEEYKSTDINFAASPDELIVAKELALLIDITISNMPPQQQKVLNLKFKECKSNTEIAELLNISRETVKTHITRGKKELRDIIMVILTLLMMQ